MSLRNQGRGAAAAAVCVVSTWSATSLAAGWDTPIVHTARHQGMGGTAIGYVDDPSASFHNPAGYAGIEGVEAIGSFSLLLGNLTTSPDDHPEAQNVKSDTVVAPFPLIGVGGRVTDWLTVGLGAYPVASGAASYGYPSSTGLDVEDRLRAVFIEVSPGFALNIPEDMLSGHKLSLGAGYRLTQVSFTRFQETEANTILDLNLSGWDFEGFRVGAQYSPFSSLQFGVVFRNKIMLDATADEGTGLGLVFQDPSLGFILPAKLGLGARFDPWRLGFSLDYEYAWQSQNDVVELAGVLDGADEPTAIDQDFFWQDGHTLRFGAEYRAPLGQNTIPVRAGYVFDGQVGNPEYPTPFGTPPTPTHSITLGSGYHVGESFQVNVAGAYRFGNVEVSERASCAFCGYPGEYKLGLLGAYIDASYEFDL